MTRIRDAWEQLAREQRLAALAAIGLFVSMILPWYSKVTVGKNKQGNLTDISQSISAFGDFSFVELAVLLVVAATLAMLVARAERRAFHLPGGDGAVILAAGVWTALLVFYRLLDKPGTEGTGALKETVGVKWGIFIALAAAILLAYAGARVRAAHRPEPPLPEPRDRTRPRRRHAPDDAVTQPGPADALPTRAIPADQAATRVARRADGQPTGEIPATEGPPEFAPGRSPAEPEPGAGDPTEPVEPRSGGNGEGKPPAKPDRLF